MTQRQSSEKNRQLYNKVVQLALGLMALFYVGLGVLVIQKQWLMYSLEKNVSYALGVLLIIYGLFRGYRAVQGLREML